MLREKLSRMVIYQNGEYYEICRFEENILKHVNFDLFYISKRKLDWISMKLKECHIAHNIKICGKTYNHTGIEFKEQNPRGCQHPEIKEKQNKLKISSQWKKIIHFIEDEDNMTNVNYCWMSFRGAQVVKNPPANTGDARDIGHCLFQEDPLE